MQLVVHRIHEKPERYLEGIVDLHGVDREAERWLDQPDDGQHAVARSGEIGIEIAEWRHGLAFETDLLVGFPQRRRQGRGVVGIDLAAREGNLPGMLPQARMPRREEDRHLGVVLDDRHQDGGGAR